MSGYIGPYYMIDDRVGADTTWGAEDINRIGGAINYIQNEASKFGVTFTAAAKDDYQMNEWVPLATWLASTWDPLLDTCTQVGMGSATQLGEWTASRGLDVTTANWMERFLLLAWESVTAFNPLYTNAAYAGDYIIG